MKKISCFQCGFYAQDFTLLIPSKLCMQEKAREIGQSAGEAVGRGAYAAKEGIKGAYEGVKEGIKGAAKGAGEGVDKAKERNRQRDIETDLQASPEEKREIMFSRLAEKTGLSVSQIENALYVSGSVKSRDAVAKQEQINHLRKILAHSDEVPHLEITLVGATEDLPPNFEKKDDAWFEDIKTLLRQMLDDRRIVGPDEVATTIDNYRPIIELFLESDDPREFASSHRDAFVSYNGLIQIARAYGRAMGFRREIFATRSDDGKGFPATIREKIFLHLQKDHLADFQRGGIFVEHDARPDTAEEQRVALEKVSGNPVRVLDAYAKSKGWKGMMIWPGKNYDYRDLAKYMNVIKLGLDAVDRQKDPAFRDPEVRGRLRIALNPKGIWNTVKDTAPDAWKTVMPRDVFGKEMHNDQTTGAHFFTGFREEEGDIIAIDYDNSVTSVVSTDIRDEIAAGVMAYIEYRERGGDEKPEMRAVREELRDKIQMYLDNAELLFPERHGEIDTKAWNDVLDICESPVRFTARMSQDRNFALKNLREIRKVVFDSYLSRVTTYIAMWDQEIGADALDSGMHDKKQWMDSFNKLKTHPPTKRQAEDIRFVVEWEKYIDGNLHGLKPKEPGIIPKGKGEKGKEGEENFENATRADVEAMHKRLEAKYKIPIELMREFGDREYKYDYPSMMRLEANLSGALKIIATHRTDLVEQLKSTRGIMIAWEPERSLDRVEIFKETGWIETAKASANEPPTYRMVVDHTDSSKKIAETIAKAMEKSFEGDPEKFAQYLEGRLSNDYGLHVIIDRDSLTETISDWKHVEDAFLTLPDSTKKIFIKKKGKNQEITLYIYNSGWGSPLTLEGRIGNNQIRIDSDEGKDGIQNDLITGAQDQEDYDNSMWEKLKDMTKVWNWAQGEWKWPWSK